MPRWRVKARPLKLQPFPVPTFSTKNERTKQNKKLQPFHEADLCAQRTGRRGLACVKTFIMRLAPFLAPFLAASPTNNAEEDSSEVPGAAGCAWVWEDQREGLACTAPCSPPPENVAAAPRCRRDGIEDTAAVISLQDDFMLPFSRRASSECDQVGSACF